MKRNEAKNRALFNISQTLIVPKDLGFSIQKKRFHL
jgi:hypothetical protein